MLQYLRISDIDFTPTCNGPRIPLPSLRNVAIIRVSLPLSYHLLEHFDLPANVLVRVSDGDPGDNDNNLQTRLPCIPHMHVIAAVSRLEVSVDQDSMHLLAEGSDDGALWITSSHYPHSGVRAPQWMRWLSSLHIMLSLDSLTTLHICLESSNVLSDILPHTPRLSELAIQDILHLDSLYDPWLEEASIRKALSSDEVPGLYAILGGEGGDGQPLLCPDLRFLALEIADLSPLALPSNIVNLAAARALSGNRLQRLSIRTHSRHLRCIDNPNFRAQDFIDDGGVAFGSIQDYLGEFDYGTVDAAGRVCKFEMRDMWVDPEAERYWTLGDTDRLYHTSTYI